MMDDLIHYHNNNYRLMDDVNDAEGRGGSHRPRLTPSDLLASLSAQEVMRRSFICICRGERVYVDSAQDLYTQQIILESCSVYDNGPLPGRPNHTVMQ